MPYDVKKFVFTVSLCAMLAANPVLATVPGDDESVDTAHNVYVESILNKATNGIAGVGYVNRMVDAAGNAAQAAEGHAAAAGKHALSAAKSAGEAHAVLEDKVNIDQGTDNKNKAMVTDDEGSVYAGYVAPDMIANGGKIDDVATSPYSGFVLWSDHKGNVSWKTVDREVLADGAVTSYDIANNAVTSDKISGAAVTSVKIADNAVTADKIADNAVTTAKIDKGAVTLDKINTSGENSGALVFDGTGVAEWGKIEPGWINVSGYVSGALITSSSGVATWGNIEPGWINAGGYVSGALIPNSSGVAEWGKIEPGWIASGYSRGVLVTNSSGVVGWGYVGEGMLADGAVTSGVIAAGAVYGGHIANGAVTADKIYVRSSEISSGNDTQSFLYAYESGNGVEMHWGKIKTAGISDGAVTSSKIYDGAVYGRHIANGAVTNGKIANGAVTIDKTAGVVGMVPVGSAGANTYGQFWIE